MSLPDLVPLPAIYRWLRDEVPGGKVAAPVLTWMLIIAALTWSAQFVWTGLGSPIANVLRGATPSIPIGQTIVGVLLVSVFFGALAWLTMRVNRIVKRLNAAAEIIAAIAYGANTEFPRVDTRIDELTTRVEKLEARPSGLRRIDPANSPIRPTGAAAKGLMDALMKIRPDRDG